jgi:hypothetical protein
MSQLRRRIQLPLIGTILLCLFIGVYLVACRRFAKSDPSGTVTKHPVETPSDEVLKYWSADKMRNAKGVDLPNVDALKQEQQHPRRPPHKPSSPHQD